MKVPVRKLSDEEVRRTHPIAGRVPGWYFRIWERSMGAWCVEGTDLWGRIVGDTGHDENAALERCIAAAIEINKQLAEGGEPQ